MKKLSKLILASAVIASPFCLAADGFTVTQKQEINQMIGQYLSNNPTQVMHALVKFKEQEMQKQQQASKSAIIANSKQLMFSQTSPILGNPKGDVTIVEFLDYRCGHCKEMENVTKKLIAADSNVKLIVKQLPIFSGESVTAAQYALVANKHGKFASLHHKLLSANEPLTTATINTMVKQAGIDLTLIKKEAAQSWVKAEIDNNMQVAKKIGLMGTPAFVVINSNNSSHNELVPGAISYAKLQDLVNNIRSFK